MPKPNGFVQSLSVPLERILTEDWAEDRELTASMAAVGLIHNIVVWAVKERYAVAAGRGRVASAKALSWTEIDADVYAGELQAMAAIALAERVRRDNFVAEAAQIAMLRSAGRDAAAIRAISGLNVSQQQARLDMLELPAELRLDLVEGRLRPSAAKLLLKLPSDEARRGAMGVARNANAARGRPYPYPTVGDVAAAVRQVRAGLQPQLPVPVPPDVEPGPPDPVAVAAAVRRVYEDTAPDGPLGDAYVAVIADLEGFD